MRRTITKGAARFCFTAAWLDGPSGQARPGAPADGWRLPMSIRFVVAGPDVEPPCRLAPLGKLNQFLPDQLAKFEPIKRRPLVGQWAMAVCVCCMATPGPSSVWRGMRDLPWRCRCTVLVWCQQTNKSIAGLAKQKQTVGKCPAKTNATPPPPPHESNKLGQSVAHKITQYDRNGSLQRCQPYGRAHRKRCRPTT